MLLAVLAEIWDVFLADSLTVLHFPGCLAIEVFNAITINSLYEFFSPPLAGCLKDGNFGLQYVYVSNKTQNEKNKFNV